MDKDMKKVKSIPEWIALLEYQRRLIENQDHRIGRNLYLATDIKEREQ